MPIRSLPGTFKIGKNEKKKRSYHREDEADEVEDEDGLQEASNLIKFCIKEWWMTDRQVKRRKLAGCSRWSSLGARVERRRKFDVVGYGLRFNSPDHTHINGIRAKSLLTTFPVALSCQSFSTGPAWSSFALTIPMSLSFNERALFVSNRAEIFFAGTSTIGSNNYLRGLRPARAPDGGATPPKVLSPGSPSSRGNASQKINLKWRLKAIIVEIVKIQRLIIFISADEIFSYLLW